MQTIFRLISTPAFEKEVKSLTKRDPELFKQLTEILGQLKEDPF
jgi:mRNA-degrading endonuclease RelE of RelBE toxin-antitoxin system